MFLKVLLQLFQGTLMKKSMTNFGFVLVRWALYFDQNVISPNKIVEIFGDEIISNATLQWIPVLVASNNISTNKLVSLLWQILSWEHILKAFHFNKNILPKENLVALKAKIFFKKVSEDFQKKSLFWNLLVAKF